MIDSEATRHNETITQQETNGNMTRHTHCSLSNEQSTNENVTHETRELIRKYTWN